MKLDFVMRKHQMAVYKELKRFNVLLAHRRFGKTVEAIMVLIIKALECKLKNPTVHYYAPSYSQAKKVAWAYLKEFTVPLGAEYNESELMCRLPNGAVIQLGSADNPDSSRGIYSDYCVLDEPANMPSRMFTEVLRPALSDRLGGCLMIGTPNGRHGLFYDSFVGAAGQDDWWSGVYRASETGIVAQSELDAARRVMSKAEYEQEYECSWDAAVKGAYWGETMNQIERDGHLTRILHDESAEVFTAWDLGVNDSTAIWFFQMNGMEIKVIDHEEYQNMGLPQIVTELRSKGYNYGTAILPHDGRVRSMSTGKTRIETLESLGFKVVVAPKASGGQDMADHIDTVRIFLKRCWFDSVKCAHGIECLRQYRSEWDTKKGVARLAPLHDWSSHSADAMRYLATMDLGMLTDTWGEELEYFDTKL